MLKNGVLLTCQDQFAQALSLHLRILRPVGGLDSGMILLSLYALQTESLPLSSFLIVLGGSIIFHMLVNSFKRSVDLVRHLFDFFKDCI
jgi:hypothetical protein